jgi:hypothetical protein
MQRILIPYMKWADAGGQGNWMEWNLFPRTLSVDAEVEGGKLADNCDGQGCEGLQIKALQHLASPLVPGGTGQTIIWNYKFVPVATLRGLPYAIELLDSNWVISGQKVTTGNGAIDEVERRVELLKQVLREYMNCVPVVSPTCPFPCSTATPSFDIALGLEAGVHHEIIRQAMGAGIDPELATVIGQTLDWFYKNEFNETGTDYSSPYKLRMYPAGPNMGTSYLYGRQLLSFAEYSDENHEIVITSRLQSARDLLSWRVAKSRSLAPKTGALVMTIRTRDRYLAPTPCHYNLQSSIDNLLAPYYAWWRAMNGGTACRFPQSGVGCWEAADAVFQYGVSEGFDGTKAFNQAFKGWYDFIGWRSGTLSPDCDGDAPCDNPTEGMLLNQMEPYPAAEWPQSPSAMVAGESVNVTWYNYSHCQNRYVEFWQWSSIATKQSCPGPNTFVTGSDTVWLNTCSFLAPPAGTYTFGVGCTDDQGNQGVQRPGVSGSWMFTVEGGAVSEHRVCGLLSMAVSSYRYQARGADEDLRSKLVSLAREKPRFGYRRLHVLLQRDGVRVNHKRTYRLHREAGLCQHCLDNMFVGAPG